MPSFAEELHEASRLACSFAPDFAQNKSMQANCSRVPEKVFSTRYNLHPTSDHCDVDPIAHASAWKDVSVNLKLKYVRWNEEILVDPEQRSQIAERRAKKENLSLDEAKSQIAENLSRPYVSMIQFVHKTFDRNYEDPITGDMYEEPVLSPSLIILFGSDNDNYSLYVSENSEAIVTQYHMIGDSNWVSMRFGKCKAIE